MRHQAGLVAPNSKMMIENLADLSKITEILATQTPNWR